jgi:hypothetical protein
MKAVAHISPIAIPVRSVAGGGNLGGTGGGADAPAAEDEEYGPLTC